MRPIPSKYLKYTFTMYNRFSSPDSGENSFHRSLLSKVFLETESTSVSTNSTMGGAGMGTARVFAATLWIDAKASIVTGDNGIRKQYLPLDDWLVAEDKSRFWTLQGQDYLVEGNSSLALTPQNEKELVGRKHYRLQEFAPIRDASAKIHHWECALV